MLGTFWNDEKGKFLFGFVAYINRTIKVLKLGTKDLGIYLSGNDTLVRKKYCHCDSALQLRVCHWATVGDDVVSIHSEREASSGMKGSLAGRWGPCWSCSPEAREDQGEAWSRDPMGAVNPRPVCTHLP